MEQQKFYLDHWTLWERELAEGKPSRAERLTTVGLALATAVYGLSFLTGLGRVMFR